MPQYIAALQCLQLRVWQNIRVNRAGNSLNRKRGPVARAITNVPAGRKTPPRSGLRAGAGNSPAPGAGPKGMFLDWDAAGTERPGVQFESCSFALAGCDRYTRC
jgi:hypothetical protein